jgi:hypothetical protein
VARRRAIREKLLLGALLVGVMVVVLSASSFLGVYSYRRLVRALSARAAELPRASALDEQVGLARLGVKLKPAELGILFDFFDKDGSGSAELAWVAVSRGRQGSRGGRLHGPGARQRTESKA